LDVRCQVPFQHPVHLWIINIRRGRRWRPEDAASGASTRTHHTGTWTRSNVSSYFICIRRCVDSFAGLYIRTAKIVQGILVVTSILRPLLGASSSSSSAASPKPDSSDDYPKIGVGTCGDSVVESHLICSNKDPSRNSSSRYTDIGRSEVSHAPAP
jgi:hypothetical protein